MWAIFENKIYFGAAKINLLLSKTHIDEKIK